MKQFKFTFLVLLAFVGFNNMSAQDVNNPWMINVGVNSVDVRNSSGDKISYLRDWAGPHDLNIIPTISSISVGRYLNDGFSLHVGADVNKIQKGLNWAEGDALTSQAFLDVDGTIRYSLSNLFNKSGWFDPFVSLGGGYSWIDWEGTGTLNGGGGANLWLNDNVALSLNTEYKHSFDNKISPYFQHQAGFAVKFGGTDTDKDGVYDKDDACPEVFGLASLQGCPDADGDGIKDADDNCPEVAGPAENKGCPDTDGDKVLDKDDACPTVAGIAALKGCPDSDKDGVADNDDACPQEAGVKENKGCPWPDTDGDGILDKDDACPSVAGVKEEKGCPAKPKEVITQEAKAQLDTFAKAIYFNSAKDSFKPGVTTKLDQIVEIMKQYPNAKFSVEGHTDSDGDAKLNLKLSEKRANAVKNYLEGKGIIGRLVSVGYGEEKPVADNKTAAGKAENRRVEVNLVK